MAVANSPHLMSYGFIEIVVTILKREVVMRRIMYVECKGQKLGGPGRIGWVEMTNSGRSFLYQGKQLLKTKSGYKYNCIEVETGDQYWVSGPKKRGGDTLYGGVVEIDEDAREEYWLRIRNLPENIHLTKYRG